jgi:uncharacterized membrane protein YfcA
MLLPIMAIGFLLGVAVSSRINDKISRYIIVILLIISGSTLIVKNLIQ